MVGTNDKLQTVDIQTGQTRWTQPAAAPRGPVAIGGAVIAGAGGLVQVPPLMLPGSLLIQAADPGYACPV